MSFPVSKILSLYLVLIADQATGLKHCHPVSHEAIFNLMRRDNVTFKQLLHVKLQSTAIQKGHKQCIKNNFITCVVVIFLPKTYFCKSNMFI